MVDLRIITLRDGLLLVGGEGGIGRGGGDGVEVRLMFHRPSPVVLLWPWKMVVAFFVTCIFSFVNMTVHPSSHNCPTEIKLLCRFGNKEVFVAVGLR